MEQKPRFLTGIKPTGTLHFGNYFGALKPFVDNYENYDSFLMVADYHALTTERNPEQLRKQTIDIVKDYLAVGVDPEKVVLFQQSDVPAHMELAWIFECLVSVPCLMQEHAYKDKLAKGAEANAGLFNYPMLMAADILLYNTAVVPVGEDQRQHVEYAREAASKFNTAYTNIFTPPQEKILEHVGTVPGIDGQKMSKSYNNYIPLFASSAEITALVRKIVTDSDGDNPTHVYALHSLFRSASELEPIYEANRGQYGELKKQLAADIDAFIAPMRERREAIDDDDVRTVLASGAERANEVATETLTRVRNAIGITL